MNRECRRVPIGTQRERGLDERPTERRQQGIGMLKADIVLLAVPCDQRQEVAKARASWAGKIGIDVRNTLDDLSDVPSSIVMDRALPGAQWSDLLGAGDHSYPRASPTSPP